MKSTTKFMIFVISVIFITGTLTLYAEFKSNSKNDKLIEYYDTEKICNFPVKQSIKYCEDLSYYTQEDCKKRYEYYIFKWCSD